MPQLPCAITRLAPELTLRLSSGQVSGVASTIKQNVQPWLSGAVGWSIVPVTKKGCGFDPRSGSMPRWWV